VIDRMRAAAGRYFIGYSPDVTSGIANAALSGTFFRLSSPLSMTGLSRHSTGHRNFFAEPDALSSAEARRDFGTIEADPNLPDLNALSLFLARDMLLLKQLLFAGDADVTLDFKGLAQSLANEINDRPALHDRTLQSIRGLAARHAFDVTDLVIPARQPDRPAPGKGVRATGAHRVQFELDGAALGLRTIADAVRVIGQFAPEAGPSDLSSRETAGRTPRLDGRGLDLGHGGNGVAALMQGWSEPEEWGTWSVARHCTLRLEVDPVPPRPRDIRLSCRAFVSGPNPVLRAVCHVGEGPAQELIFSTSAFAGVQTLLLDPAAIAADGTFTISFALTDPRSPADLGLGPDVRPLGIGIERIWLAEESDAGLPTG